MQSSETTPKDTDSKMSNDRQGEHCKIREDWIYIRAVLLDNTLITVQKNLVETNSMSSVYFP